MSTNKRLLLFAGTTLVLGLAAYFHLKRKIGRDIFPFSDKPRVNSYRGTRIYFTYPCLHLYWRR